MQTEEEARKKWCPFALVLGTLTGRDTADQPDRIVASGAQNRGYQMGGALYNCHCIASNCMMWRWKGMEPVRSVTPGIGPTLYEYRDNPEARTLGYCGMGGASNP